MPIDKELKELVQKKYSEIAWNEKEENQSSCCGSGCCSTEVHNIMTDDYSAVSGYQPEADLGLGCGLPTEFANIREGDTVVDLGSGAGNDAFIARAEAGESGKVIGIDFTPAMVDRARLTAEKLGFTNVEFILGDIEHMPVADAVADVVVSNCVLSLVPNKNAVLKEIYQVLKPGGHFSISDIVLQGELPESVRGAAEMYAGCVSGSIQKDEYLRMIKATGFQDIAIQKERPIIIPNDILREYLGVEELRAFRNSGTGIFSITVYAEKASVNQAACCGPECCQ